MEVTDSHRLLELVQHRMPFGKYQGVIMADLPENYLIWFYQQGFPQGKLGEQLGLLYQIKLNGLEELLAPLREGHQPHSKRQ